MRGLLVIGLVLALAVPANAALQGADTKPGDACTVAETGYTRRNASATLDASEITMICNGSVWVSANGTLRGTDVAGACTNARDGLIKYNSSGSPPWQYCDGGSSSWLPFRLPQCQNDGTGECTLAALRSSDDPQFVAANIRCGSNILGVTGTMDVGSSNSFNFTDVTGANLSTLVTANAVTITGIPSGCPGRVEVSGQGAPQISVDGGSWGPSGSISNGQSLRVRLTSSASFNTMFTATVAIGGTADNWSVTTRVPNGCSAQSKTWLSHCTATVSAAIHGASGSASISNPGGCGTAYYGSATFTCADGVFSYASGSCVQQTACDTTPNAFSFTDQTNVALSTLATSNTITISGINTGASVSVSGSGAQISINGGGWVTSGTIANGQSLRVRLTSSGSFSTARTATVNVGGVTDNWSVTTYACGGTIVGGYCWYMGSDGQNCDQVCASHGGCNLTATRDYAGSGGTNANCEAVLYALTGQSYTVSGGAYALGCILGNGGNPRRTILTTNCTSYLSLTNRACACNN